jgi:hypothetical protein
LAEILTAKTAVEIVYSRPDALGGCSATMRATRGSTPYESTNADGLIERIVARDYLIETATFPFELPPRDEDEITDGDEIYVVHSMSGGQPYRFADPGKSIVRVHTKLLRRVPE